MHALHIPRDRWPVRLRELPPKRLRELWVAGDLPARCCVAIVGTRHPVPEAQLFAATLAAAVVRHGGIVVSGGAHGIDAAAHEGALAEGGSTCAVLPTGADRVYPEGSRPLFEAIAAAPGGSVIFPFAQPSRAPIYDEFHRRNAVLVALSDVVVVVAAGVPSGALSAAAWARRLGKPLLAVAAPPWDARYRGSTSLVAAGAAPVVSIRQILLAARLLQRGERDARGAGSDAVLASKLRSLEGDPRGELASRKPSRGASPRSPGQLDLTSVAPPRARAPAEVRVLAALGEEPQHADEIAEKTGLSASELGGALLTLGLDCVLVEGPSGWFRRNSPRKMGSDGQDADRRRVASEGEDDQEVPGGWL